MYLTGVPQEYTPPLLVCTAHIHWDPEFCDVKLVQTMMLMHELRLIADEFNPPGISSKNIQPNDKVHLLLCGDFNSLPESGMHNQQSLYLPGSKKMSIIINEMMIFFYRGD